MRELLRDAATTWTEDEARKVIEAWRRSGETLAAFARQHRLAAHRLYWWRRRFLSSVAPTTVSFVPATVIEPATAVMTATAVVIRLANNVTIEISSATPAWIAAVVGELTRSSP